MKCISSNNSGFSEIPVELACPVEFDIVVEIHAGSINPVDVKVKSSLIGTTHKVLGYDAAGVVVDRGELVSDLAIGDRVYYAGDISREGSNASHQIVDSRIVAKMPMNIDAEAAAAIPLTGLTAYESLFDRMGIASDSTGSVLVINGAGGVGSMAIQLLKAKTNCLVIATASRPESTLWCKEQGADFVLDHSNPLKPQLDTIGVGEVTYILNCADSSFHLKNMAESIRPHGKICCLVDFTEPVDMNLFKRKSVTFVWEFMFTRPLFKTEDMIRQKEILTELANLIDCGDIKSTQTVSLGVLSAETIAEGHRLISTGKTIGKLTWRANL